MQCEKSASSNAVMWPSCKMLYLRYKPATYLLIGTEIVLPFDRNMAVKFYSGQIQHQTSLLPSWQILGQIEVWTLLNIVKK